MLGDDRAFHKLLGNFLATFFVSSNFFGFKQFFAFSEQFPVFYQF